MRRRQHEEPENLERWLVSYADFITLLFAFFVVLYAISSVNEGKYRVLSSSLVEAFDTIPRSIKPVQVGEINRIKRDSLIDNAGLPEHDSPADEYGNEDPSRLNLAAMADEIEQAMRDLIEREMINVRRSDNWLEVEINTNILFASGSATLVEPSEPVLRKIAKILAPFPNPINVEGFTDNLPINTTVYPSNWELSAARAASVVHLFSRHGVVPDRMTALGYGEHRPVADNGTSAGRSRNRRVVLAILAEGFYARANRQTVESKKLERTMQGISIK